MHFSLAQHIYVVHVYVELHHVVCITVHNLWKYDMCIVHIVWKRSPQEAFIFMLFEVTQKFAMMSSTEEPATFFFKKKERSSTNLLCGGNSLLQSWRDLFKRGLTVELQQLASNPGSVPDATGMLLRMCAC